MFQLVGCRFIECGLLPMAFTLVVLCGCGGSSTPSSQLSVGGSYSTRVTLLPTGNTCGNVTVQDNPTVVTHSPGASTLSLTHANNTYQGTISSTAQFSTTPTTISGGGSQFTIIIQGQFNLTGFDATVQVNVMQPGPPTVCAYMVHWVGTKNGPPNTIP